MTNAIHSGMEEHLNNLNASACDQCGGDVQALFTIPKSVQRLGMFEAHICHKCRQLGCPGHPEIIQRSASVRPKCPVCRETIHSQACFVAHKRMAVVA